MNNRIYLDTEFIEDGHTIEPVSIAMVKATGEEYYSEFEIPRDVLVRADSWVVDNVLEHLEGKPKPHHQIADEIIAFVGEEPEFWAYYADYDWVLLCQLYGRMIDLPKGWPMYCRDFRQVLDLEGLAMGLPTSVTLLPEDGAEHHALADARALKRVAEQVLSDRALGVNVRMDRKLGEPAAVKIEFLGRTIFDGVDRSALLQTQRRPRGTW